MKSFLLKFLLLFSLINLLLACTEETGSDDDVTLTFDSIKISIPNGNEKIEDGESIDIELKSDEVDAFKDDFEIALDFDKDIQSVEVTINGEEFIVNDEDVNIFDLVDFEDGEFEIEIVAYSEEDAEGDKGSKFDFTINIDTEDIDSSSDEKQSSFEKEDSSSSDKDASSSSEEDNNSSDDETNSSEEESSSSENEAQSSEGESSDTESSSSEDDESSSSEEDSSSSKDGSIDRSGLGKFEPPAGKTVVIVGQNNGPTEEYGEDIEQAAGFMSYINVFWDGGDFYTDTNPGKGVDYFRDKYKSGEIGPFSLQIALALLEGSQGEFKHEEFLNGQKDGWLLKLADMIKDLGFPVFMRIEYELTLKIYPEGYKEVFRYIREFMENEGVDNIAYVWHPAVWYCKGCTGQGDQAYDDHFQWYPGDDVVDWIAVSFFNYAVGYANSHEKEPDAQNQNQKFRQAFADSAKAKGKPLMIGEASPNGQYLAPGSIGAESWERYYEPFLEFIETNDVKAICLINQNWSTIPNSGWDPAQWGDTRVQADPTVQQNWVEAMESDRFIHSDDMFYENIGYTP